MNDIFFKSAAAGLRPDPIQTVSSWSDQHRVLSSKDSSEPGRFRTDRTPYAKEIMDCLSNDSPVERVVFIAGAQISKTTIGLNWIGYVTDVAPGPMLCVQPTVDLAKRFSKQRVDPMIEDTVVLREKFSTGKRDADNTLLMKQFPGGAIMIAGANSAAALRSMPIRYLFLDEVDAYPADLDGEGSPIALAEKRTTTFNRRKIFLSSTPTLKDASVIEMEYKKGDQCKYFVPCPHCGEYQSLEWKNMKWIDNDPSTAKYLCSYCGVLIEERYKTIMLKEGQWRASAKGDGKTRSFHISSLYSPLGWKSWPDIVREFLQAKDDPPALKTWVNTILGETWEDQYQSQLDPNNLMGRAEDYGISDVPEGVLFCTMGVDTQDDRLAVSIYGWGVGEEAWAIYHHELYGDPALDEVWLQLDEVRHTPVVRRDGRQLSIECCAIDSGGHYTQQVYDYVRQRRSEHVIAVKGSSLSGKPVMSKPSRVDFKKNGQPIKKGAEVYMVGVSIAKTTIYSRLKKLDTGPAYYHFPKSFNQEFYNQLTSEKVIVKWRNGMPEKVWFKKDSVRNEALDTAVYAYAGLQWVYLRMNRHTLWEQFRQKVDNQPVLKKQQSGEFVPNMPVVVKQQAQIQRKKSSFWA